MRKSALHDPLHGQLDGRLGAESAQCQRQLHVFPRYDKYRTSTPLQDMVKVASLNDRHAKAITKEYNADNAEHGSDSDSEED